MASEDWLVQVSVKLNDGTMVNVRSDNPDELWQAVDNVVANSDKISNLSSSLGAVDAITKNFGASVISHQAAPPQDYGTAPAGAAGVTIENNKWGGTYELGRPDAEMTPWGPAVLKHAKSQAGKHYKRWIDPRSKEVPSNYAKGIRDDPQDKWDGAFFNG
jgi:hypothetical protein